MRYGALLTLIALVIAFSSAANAATFLVSKTADTNDGTCDADCSLREAVIAANAAAGADTIVLPTGTFLLTIPDTDEDFAANGDLDIRDELALNGLGTAATIVDGNNATRVFHLLTNAPVSIRDLAIRNASTSGFGAAIHHTGAGAVTLSNLARYGQRRRRLRRRHQQQLLRRHQHPDLDDLAQHHAGIVLRRRHQQQLDRQHQHRGLRRIGQPRRRLGRRHQQQLDRHHQRREHRRVGQRGGRRGGGINNNDLGTLTVLTSTVSDNSSQGWGGGINNNDAGPATITLTTISGNSAENGGGINNNEAGALTLDRSTVAGNTATDTSGFGGGGILNNGMGSVTLTATTVSGNAIAGDGGGGINNNASGTVTLTNCTISGNRPRQTRASATTAEARAGGGIYDNASSGAVVLDFVTLTGNDSTTGGRSLHVNNVRGGFGVFSLRNTHRRQPVERLELQRDVRLEWATTWRATRAAR